MKEEIAAEGIVNSLNKRSNLEPGTELYGLAFENFICHELHAYRSYTRKKIEISFWGTATGLGVDFILGEMEVAIEVKSSDNVQTNHLKPLKQLADDYQPARRIVVSRDERKRITHDGIEIIPVKEFLFSLWAGEII